MSAKYKALLAQLEQEQEDREKSTTSSTINTNDGDSAADGNVNLVKLYPSRAISQDDNAAHDGGSGVSSPLLPNGVSRKKRGAKQNICEINEITTIDKNFVAAANKKLDFVATASGQQQQQQEQHKSSDEAGDENCTVLPSPPMITTVSLNKILPTIPSDILRDRIKQLSPITDRLIDDWRTVSHLAALAPSKFEANIFPEMPKLSEVVEFSDFVKSSLDVCGLASLDGDSLQMMQRIIQRNERVARNATDSYEAKEHLVLEWIFKSQASTIRALKADVEQISAFIQLREIVLNHCNSVLGCINASINRVHGVAATERTCNRERILLNEIGRTRLMLASKAVNPREAVEIEERLALLPYRQNAIKLDDSVHELTQYDDVRYLVKDLAAAHNRVRRAEELADLILKQMRETESHEEEKWNVWNEKYSLAREKMNSAKVVKIRSTSSSDDDDENNNNNDDANDNEATWSGTDEEKMRKKRRRMLRKKKQLHHQRMLAAAAAGGVTQENPNSHDSSFLHLHDDEYEMIVQKKVPVSVTTGKPLVADLDAFVKRVQEEDRKSNELRKKRNQQSVLVPVGRSRTIEEEN